jgi:hypothetical protein
MWRTSIRFRRISAITVIVIALLVCAFIMPGPFWGPLLSRAIVLMPSRVAGNWTEVCFGLGIFIVAQIIYLFRLGWPEMQKKWKESIGIGVLSAGLGWVGLFCYSLYLEVDKIGHDAQSTLSSEEPFQVAVEFARVSFGGKDYGTSLWIRYPSRDGSCGEISPIQGMYFLSIKNRKNTPVSVVGYGIDSFGVPLIRVRTQMGAIVGTPNVIDGHFLHPRLKFSDLVIGQSFDFGQGPGFSGVTVPVNQSDFSHGIVLKMDLIDDLLQKPLQPGIPVRGWAFLQPPNNNAFTIAGAGHVILETDDSKTFSYAFDLRNPHPGLDNMHRIITVQSFINLSDCHKP